jgi:hypothetical protein
MKRLALGDKVDSPPHKVGERTEICAVLGANRNYWFLSFKKRANILDFAGLNFKFCLHSIQTFKSSFTVNILYFGTKDQTYNSLCQHYISTVFGHQAVLLNVHAVCTIWRPLCFNPLNAELNPVCHLLTLAGALHFVDVSRIKVKGFIQLLF